MIIYSFNIFIIFFFSIKCSKKYMIEKKTQHKTNRYKLLLLNFVGVTPTGMILFASFAYVEGERVNNLVWALQRFRDLF